MVKAVKSMAELGNLFNSAMAEQFGEMFGVSGLNTYDNRPGGRRQDMYVEERQPNRRKRRVSDRITQTLSGNSFTDQRVVGNGIKAVTKRKFNINPQEV